MTATASLQDRGRADGRVPPYNLEAEESLLGAMLLSRDAIGAASEVGVSADDFYKSAHAHVYDAITSLYSAGEPADPVTVGEELRRAGLLADVGGPGLLVSLQVRTPATSSAARYARIVSEHALLRRLISVAGEIAEMGYRVPDDVAEAVDRAEALVFDVAQHRVSDTMAPIRDLLDHSLTRLESLYEKGDAITGVPTGYQGLDELLSGLQPSSLVIVGARPATGKCLTGDTLLTDPRSGARTTLAEVYRRGFRGEAVEVTSLGESDHRLHVRRPSAFVDDGIRPVFRVRTRLGREVRSTAAHPFLTRTGWRRLADIAVGTAIAVPRELPVFGDEPRPEAEIALLAHLLADSAHTTTSVRVATDSAAVVADLERHAGVFGARVSPERRAEALSTWRLVTPPDQADLLGKVLHEHGLVGVRIHARCVPEAMFRLPRPQLALFLGRLLGPGASAWWSTRDGGSACVSYCSVSRRLVADVAHLLLRFGINARLRRRVIQRRGWRGPAYELELTTIDDIRRLAGEIGLFSKEAVLVNLLTRMERRPGPSVEASGTATGGAGHEVSGTPLVPVVAVRRGQAVGAAASRPGPAAGSLVEERPLSTGTTPAVLWDDIVAIDAYGDDQVYDLTVPGDHNFVAADIFVHNTAFALGMAAHAALEANRPVLFFSLEMSHLEITQRLLAAEARVDSSRLRNGKLAESDWTKISHAIGRLAEAPLYIDDNPRATVLEIRAKSRRLKSRLGDLGIVVVDYLQLMTGRNSAENRQVEVSEISRGLKVLARELQTPVVALSQLSRNLELRADKRPMLSDLRESGCMPASTRLMRADTGEEISLGELVLSQEQPLVWSLDEHLRLVPAQLTKAFPSGVKPVFRLRLASGREVDATSNHPFLTVQGWSALEELTVGSFIAAPRHIPPPTAAPATWTDDELVLLAHLLGDGSIGPNGVKYATADPANKQAVEESAKRALGIEVRGDRLGRTWQLWLPSPYRVTHKRRHPVRNWLEPHGLWGSRAATKFIPESIFGLQCDKLAIFLRHLWATDGSITIGRNQRAALVRTYYATNSRRLAQNVQRALLRFEIRSRVAPTHNKGYAENWHVVLQGAPDQLRFLSEIGCHGVRGEVIPKATGILESHKVSPNIDLVPWPVAMVIKEALATSGITYRELAAQLDEHYCGSYLLGTEDRPRRFSRTRLDRIAEVTGSQRVSDLATSDLLWDQVIEIVPLGEQPTFDATVDKTHNFIANGVVAHNSLEQDADVVMFLYRDELYHPESPDRGTAEVLVTKHRSGPTGMDRLAFLDHYTRFANMAKGI